MEIKDLFSLSSKDFDPNHIWIDYECAELFYDDFEYDDTYDEDYVIKIESGLYKQKIFELQDVDKFYIGCTIIIDSQKYNGMAYIRASDFTPYYIELFFQDQNLSIMHKMGIEETDIVKLEEKLKINRGLIYPINIQFNTNDITINNIVVNL